MCLTCSEKGKCFRSLDAVRKHMVDKGHCKIAFSGGDAIAEFADFYDYSSSYPEADDDNNDQEDQDIDMGEFSCTNHDPLKQVSWFQFRHHISLFP